MKEGSGCANLKNLRTILKTAVERATGCQAADSVGFPTAGHGIDLVLQRFLHVGTVLDLHFTLQQQELRDFLQSRAPRGLRGLCG